MIKDYPLDITAVPFGRRGAGCMVFFEENGCELDAENGLYLSQITEGVLMGGAQFLRNKNYLLITPVKGGKAVPYTYTASTSGIRIAGGDGHICMAFAPGGELKIWADGLDIRLTAKMGFGDVAEKRGHGAQIEMDGAAYSIVPVLGQVKVNSRYDLLTYRYTDPVIDILQENGRLDISVYDRKLNSEELPPAPCTFSECAEKAAEDFSRFMKSVVHVPEGMETLMYSLWVQEKNFGEEGGVMYPSNVVTAVYPRAAEQPILSLAFCDAEIAAGLITNFAGYATGRGLIPELVTRGKKVCQTAAMDHGYAALRLLERGGLSVTALEDMYDMLCTIDTWWRENRSYDGGVSFFCAYPFECGDVKSSVNSRGLPVVTPDLMVKMIFTAEALAECGEQLKLDGAAGRWRETAARRLRYLTDNLWNGERFVCALPDGTKFESGSILCCTPVLLGEKLPQEQVEKTAGLIMDKFFVPGRGLKTEEGGETTDTVLSALLAAGLCDTGYAQMAGEISGAVKSCIEEYGLYGSYPVKHAPKKRCGGLYPPCACAAVLYCLGKTVK
jgi:putative isomerase